MIYLKKFEQHSEYEAYISGGGAVLPNVSICKDEPTHVHYNPVGPEPIYYTSTDGNIVEPYDSSAFNDANIVSNTYVNGQGVIKFDKDVWRIRDAFRNCETLESIIIPNTVETIEFTFQMCSSLTSVTIPDSVKFLGDYAFYKCTSLTSITIPDSVAYLGEYAFSNCTSLTSITIPDSVIGMGYPLGHTFSNCTSLVSVRLSNSSTSLGGYSFDGCTNLSDVFIPSSITAMNNHIFTGCKLDNAVFEGTISQFNQASSNGSKTNAYFCNNGKIIHCNDGDVTYRTGGK